MTAKFNKIALDSWWKLLRLLDGEAKLELVSRLVDSIKTNPLTTRRKDDGWKALCGAWKEEEETAEEMIDRIRSSRFTNRKIESLD
ncbi:MAG: hypothetical protein AAF849_08640 [Bacteroidota bacterium]